MATGSKPRYIEELRIGGGFGDPEDGGADFSKSGAFSTDGPIHTETDVSLRGRLYAGVPLAAVTNASGEVLGDRLAQGSVPRAALGVGAVGPDQLDATERFVVERLEASDGLEVGGRARLAQAAATGPIEVYDPASLGAELLTNGGFEGDWANECQLIDINSHSSGTWRLSFQGQKTAALAFDATPAQVGSALEALSAIDQVSVTGADGGPFTVEFDGPGVGARTQPLLLVTESTLAGGGGTQTVSRSQYGGIAGGWQLNDTTANLLTLSRETSDVSSGLAAQRIARTDTGAYNAWLQQPGLSLVQGKWYRLRIAIKVVSGTLPSLQVRGAAGQALLSNLDNRGWVEYTCDFCLAVAPTAGYYSLLVHTNYFSSVDVLVDAVSLRAIEAGEVRAAAGISAGGDLRIGGSGSFAGAVTASSFVDASPVYVGDDALGLLDAIRAEGPADCDGFAPVNHATLGPLRVHGGDPALRCTVGPVGLHEGAGGGEPGLDLRDLGRQIQVNSAAILQLRAMLARIECGRPPA